MNIAGRLRRGLRFSILFWGLVPGSITLVIAFQQLAAHAWNVPAAISFTLPVLCPFVVGFVSYGE